MKRKIKLERSLKLNKELVVKLQETQLSNARGGLGSPKSCYVDSCRVPPATTSCNEHSCN